MKKVLLQEIEDCWDEIERELEAGREVFLLGDGEIIGKLAPLASSPTAK